MYLCGLTRLLLNQTSYVAEFIISNYLKSVYITVKSAANSVSNYPDTVRRARIVALPVVFASGVYIVCFLHNHLYSILYAASFVITCDTVLCVVIGLFNDGDVLLLIRWTDCMVCYH